MVDPIGVTLTLLDALRAAVEGVKANKEQCAALLERAQRVAHELQRLPVGLRLALKDRNIFVTLEQTLRNAADFCVEFKGQGFLRRMLTFSSDAAKFNDFNDRFGQVIAEANLALALDDRAWEDAQRKDGKTVDEVLARMDRGFDAVQEKFASVGEDLRGQFGDLKKMMADMLLAQSKSSGYHSSGSGGSSSGGGSDPCDLAHVSEILAKCAIWELNPREVVYDEEEDARGRRGVVKLGGGASGDVHRGKQIGSCFWFYSNQN
jgi:hypothetical protein